MVFGNYVTCYCERAIYITSVVLLDKVWQLTDIEIMRFLKEVDVSGKRVFVRADLDVLLDFAQKTGLSFDHRLALFRA